MAAQNVSQVQCARSTNPGPARGSRRLRKGGGGVGRPSAESRTRLRLLHCRILLPGRDKPFQVITGLNRWVPFTCPLRAQQLPLLIPDDRIGTIGPPVTLRYESDDELWG